MTIEMVLPSGKFARVRPITALDFLLALRTEHMHAALVAYTVLIDDDPITYKEALEMELVDFLPIFKAVTANLPKL